MRDATGEIRWFGTSTDVDDRRRLLDEDERLLASERPARSDAERAAAPRTSRSAPSSGRSSSADSGNTEEKIAEGVSVISHNPRVQAQIIDDCWR